MNVWLNFLIDSLAFGATFIYGSTGEIIKLNQEKRSHLTVSGILEGAFTLLHYLAFYSADYIHLPGRHVSFASVFCQCSLIQFYVYRLLGLFRQHRYRIKREHSVLLPEFKVYRFLEVRILIDLYLYRYLLVGNCD